MFSMLVFQTTEVSTSWGRPNGRTNTAPRVDYRIRCLGAHAGTGDANHSDHPTFVVEVGHDDLEALQLARVAS